MPLRQILLRIMLWSLGLAAASGVVAVFLDDWHLVSKIIGTGCATAGACVLMLPVSLMIDRARTRAAGLVGMSAIVFEFLATLLLIWTDGTYLFPWRLVDETLGTMAVVGPAAATTMFFLWLAHVPSCAASAKVGMWVCMTTLVFVIMAIWVPYGVLGIHWAKLAWAIASTGGLAVLAMMGLDRRSRRPWRWLGVGASAIAYAMWMNDILVDSGSDIGFIVFCVLLSVAAVVAHANACLMCKLTLGQSWLRFGTIVIALACAVLVDIVAVSGKTYFLGYRSNLAELLERLAAATGIVAGCGTMAIFVLARFNRRVDLVSSDGLLESIELRCPVCRVKQVLQIGNSLCSSCGLRISIRVEEPRCPRCDYLLLHLTSNRCPECGEAFAPAASDATKASSR